MRRTAKEVADEIEDTERRQRDLWAREAALGNEIEVARTEVGEAFAEGVDEAENQRLRSRVRDREEETDGVERGLAALSERLTALKAEQHRAQVAEATAERYRTLDHATEECEALFAKFCEVSSEQVLPSIPGVKKALLAAQVADQRVQDLTGERNLNVGSRYRDTDRYWSPLLDVVEQMRALVKSATI